MRVSIKTIRAYTLITAFATALTYPVSTRGQALAMDGASGVFFDPWASVVPAEPGQWSTPTIGFHMVDAGPVAGDYINVSIEEGFGNWLEFGYTRGSHTDGGDPTLSPLFNFAGMNMFNANVKVVAENSHHHSWIPAPAIGGALRANVPYMSQTATDASGRDWKFGRSL